ncbi:MAG: recombinase family protein [Clostridiales bacterium]|nr:recombinase family protein [Clostridiales bacterium]
MNTDTIAIYVRVSTQEQAKEGYSVDEQRERLRKYCEAHDWKLIKEYVDPGFSGAKLERPSIQQLIKDVEAGKISRVLVYKLDRLSRSQKDTLYLIEDVFLKNNTDFISMTENFDTSTPFGKAMIGILSVFAQLEREQIKERMSMGKEGRAKEGKWHGGVKVPIGYRFIDDDLVVDPYEAHIVKTCFQEYASGKSVDYILAELQAAGMKTSYGELTKPTIYFMLHNNVYIGIIRHNDQEFPGLHEAIVDRKTFDLCQARFEKNRNNPRWANAFEPVTVLGGLLRCPCGCTMRIRYGWKKKDGTTTKYYDCTDNVKTGSRCKLGTRSHRIDKVQEAVFEEVHKLKLDPIYFIEKIRAARVAPAPVEEDPEIAVFRERIEEIDRQIERLIRLYTVQNIDFDIVTKQISELTAEKERLNDTIEARTEPPEETPEPVLTVDETLEALGKISLDDLTVDRVLGDREDENIKSVLEILIEKIVVSDDKIDIYWNF